MCKFSMEHILFNAPQNINECGVRISEGLQYCNVYTVEGTLLFQPPFTDKSGWIIEVARRRLLNQASY